MFSRESKAIYYECKFDYFTPVLKPFNNFPLLVNSKPPTCPQKHFTIFPSYFLCPCCMTSLRLCSLLLQVFYMPSFSEQNNSLHLHLDVYVLWIRTQTSHSWESLPCHCLGQGSLPQQPANSPLRCLPL